ncbi:hypothetical protein AB0M95_15535 [Sphaerisporangium sp. NPDC051017]|uniref:hypothetical protein n=1 Tax=Sphaerisporangium sp. NPDC051017 TaxID=3154636 RepID=UPI0034394599
MSTTAVAGWLFADLLAALVLVVLGAEVSAPAPGTAARPPASPAPAPSPTAPSPSPVVISVSDWLSDPVRYTESRHNELPGIHRSSSCPGAGNWSRRPVEHVPPDADRSGMHSPTGEGARRRLGAGRAGNSMPRHNYDSLIESESLSVKPKVFSRAVMRDFHDGALSPGTARLEIY